MAAAEAEAAGVKRLRQRLWDGPGDAILGAWVHLWETRRALAWAVAITVGAVGGVLFGLVVQFGR